MNSFSDKFQQAWQSQIIRSFDVEPKQLLSTVRLVRRVHFWTDVTLILLLSGVGVFTLWITLGNIGRNWPWLIYVACMEWVAGYLLLDRWRRRREMARYDEPVLAHVEGAINELEHQKWLSKDTLWWYTLPIAFGTMIPPVLMFVMQHGDGYSLVSFVLTETFLAGTFIFGFFVMKHGRTSALERRHKELQGLRAIRETLLSADE